MPSRFFPGMWLTPLIKKTLALQRCSLGKGVFAAETINKGDRILRFGGKIIIDKALPPISKVEHDYFLQIGEHIFIGPSGDLDDYVNHSCNPNSGVLLNSGGIQLVAIKRIPKGTQISFDYSTTMDGFWGKMPCCCGAENCRQHVSNFHELPVALQHKYIDLEIVPQYILKEKWKKSAAYISS